MLKIAYKKLSTKALGDFSTRLLALLKAFVETLLKDNPLVADLQAKNELYQQVVVKKTFSGLGTEVEILDLKRDTLYRGFKRLLKGFLRFADSEKAADAKALLAVLNEVGDMENLSYAKQNTAMRKLIEKLSAEENTNRIVRLALADEATAMAAAQTAFEAVADEQTLQNTELRQTATASAMRSELQTSLRNVLALISSMRGQPQWSGLYAQAKQLITEFKPISGKKDPDETQE